MIRFETLQAQLANKIQRAPVEQWAPEYCGGLDIFIDTYGSWYHEGQKIKRSALVRLFARVLKYEEGEYFLVTPVEKVSIEVADLPFIVTEWQEVSTEEGRAIQVFTNIGESYLLSEQNPLLTHRGLPAVKIRDGLLARVHRNVYYQWAQQLLLDQVRAEQDEGQESYYLSSGPYRFELVADV